jgi:hypothetical protein
MPVAEVRLRQQTADLELASCQDLVCTADQRIATLEREVVVHAENRAAFDTTCGQADSTRRDIITILRPPFWKRSLHWLQGHAVKAAICGTGDYLLAEK